MFCFEDSHQVSDDGKVRSVITGELLPEIRDSRGFICVTLPMPESRRRIRKRVCDLVWDSFVGNRFSLSLRVCHKDGNRRNNRITNLTLKDPLASNSNLAYEEVVEILGRRSTLRHNDIQELADEFEVTTSTIRGLLSGKTYKAYGDSL